MGKEKRETLDMNTARERFQRHLGVKPSPETSQYPFEDEGKVESPCGLGSPLPSRKRRMPMGFHFAGIAMGRTQIVSERTQLTFTPSWLFLAPECAPYFDVVTAQVGCRIQNLSANPLPGSLLSGDPERVLKLVEAFPDLAAFRWDWDTAYTGQEIFLFVRNKSDRAQDFSAILWGDAQLP